MSAAMPAPRRAVESSALVLSVAPTWGWFT
jgi:hypothetical protein